MTRLKKLDYGIFALVIALSLSPLASALGGSGAATVVVTQNGRELYRGSLAADAVIVTPDKKNTVVVQNGAAYMLEADCQDGLCVGSGNATRLRPVVCLPNGVVIEIVGKGGALDAVVY